MAVSLPETLSEDELEAQEVADRFEAALSSPEADQMTVKVYRVNDQSGKLDYCQDLTRHQFDRADILNVIRQTWGAGEFEFRLINRTGIKARRRQSIAQPIGAIPDVSAPQNNDVLNTVIQTLANGQQRILEALQARPDPMAQLAQMATMAKLMRDAFGPVNSAPVDPLQMVSQVMTMIKETRSAVKELAEEESAPPADPLMAMLPKALDAISVLSSKQNTPVQPLQPIAAPSIVPIPKPENAAPVTTPQPEAEPQPVEETAEQMFVRTSIEHLCKLAADNEPPEKGGEFIADVLPDEMLTYMKHPAWFELVAKVFPIIAPHEAWIRAAKAHADKIIAEEDSA
ncbi:MAG: hypothetical protein E6Q97_24820 [Desulfurellales bacterium]|nr:MAG: hypothetical protein E6Q97_24820 [Desulfurellales bacterium]